MVKQAVADTCLVYVAALGVGDGEVRVRAVPICFVRQVAVKREDVVDKAQSEFLHVRPVSFAADKLLPRGKKVFG